MSAHFIFNAVKELNQLDSTDVEDYVSPSLPPVDLFECTIQGSRHASGHFEDMFSKSKPQIPKFQIFIVEQSHLMMVFPLCALSDSFLNFMKLCTVARSVHPKIGAL